MSKCWKCWLPSFLLSGYLVFWSPSRKDRCLSNVAMNLILVQWDQTGTYSSLQEFYGDLSCHLQWGR